MLIISDGGQGLIGAAEVVFDRSLRQRCLIHRARNILAKVPLHAQAQVKAEYWKIFDDLDAEPGAGAQAVARNRARAFASKWRQLYPAAVECLRDDFEHLVTYLRFLAEHLMRRLLTQGRKLDVQNPQPAALGSDFGRLGFDLEPALNAEGEVIEDALTKLDLLVRFRNAVAHGNESELAGIVASDDIKADARLLPTLPEDTEPARRYHGPSGGGRPGHRAPDPATLVRGK